MIAIYIYIVCVCLKDKCAGDVTCSRQRTEKCGNQGLEPGRCLEIKKMMFLYIARKQWMRRGSKPRSSSMRSSYGNASRLISRIPCACGPTSFEV